MTSQGPRRVAVIGGGWAGIAAAVEAAAAGHAVAIFETASHLGGRARHIAPRQGPRATALDNGQHILIGAYTETLRLLRIVGVDPKSALLRLPLSLRYPDGEGLELGAGRPAAAFARAVLVRRGWSWIERAAVLGAAAGWRARRFECPLDWTVDRLTRRLSARVRRDLVEPLCVAALNTPAAEASASTFLRVLRDALFAGVGSSDLLLPRVRLGDLLPGPAARWLAAAGAQLNCRSRIAAIRPTAAGWEVDGRAFDHVVLATGADEAARLARPIDGSWARSLAALTHEPIVTVYLQAGATRLPRPMLMLRWNERDRPAQFVFDIGQLGGPAGLLAFVISVARRWVDAGSEATLAAVLSQARAELGCAGAAAVEPVRVLAEKRATFRCTPGLVRPQPSIAPGLVAAGDYVSGPYPATLEGAVRSGFAAARAIG